MGLCWLSSLKVVLNFLTAGLPTNVGQFQLFTSSIQYDKFRTVFSIFTVFDQAEVYKENYIVSDFHINMVQRYVSLVATDSRQ